MHELAEVARLREDIPPARTDSAFARLVGAMAAADATSRPVRSRRSFRGLGIVAAAVAVVAVAVAVMLPQGDRTGATSGSLSAADSLQAPSVGRAADATELVAFATRAAALTPRFDPSPRDWTYIDLLYRGLFVPANGTISQTWQQIGSERNATIVRGKLAYGSTGGPAGGLIGWPGSISRVYAYLAKLPASPSALKAVILANNRSTPAKDGGAAGGAFDAIQNLMLNFPLPPRLVAELYSVLVNLPGVQFARSATDAAARHGVGLYLIEGGFMKHEIIINPKTYAYMGDLWIAVKAHTTYATSPRILHFRKGTIDAWTAVLSSGVVEHAGQLLGH